MGLTTPDGTTYYVHPTFLYESLWNLIGFIIIDRYWYRKNHRKYDGQIFLFYVLWYGAGRACVEGLRTDSLYIPGTNIRTSQLVAAVSALVALVILLVNIKRPHKPTYVSTLEAAAAAGDAPEADAVTETETTEAAGDGADSADTGSDTTEKTEESKND
jgi:phosphatidylglycerol:prolipoprotein diacylglycerol transferase